MNNNNDILKQCRCIQCGSALDINSNCLNLKKRLKYLESRSNYQTYSMNLTVMAILKQKQDLSGRSQRGQGSNWIKSIGQKSIDESLCK